MMLKFDTIRIEYFKKLFPYIKKNTPLFFCLFVFKAIFMILDLVTPYFYYILVNAVLTEKKINLLLYVFSGYIIIYLLKTFFVVFNKSIYNRLFVKFNITIKTKLLTILTKMKLTQYSNYNTGDLVNRLDNDVSMAEIFFNTHVLNYIFSIVSIIAIVVILLKLNIFLAIISLVVVPLSFKFAKFMGNKAKESNAAQRELIGKYESFLHITFQNWKEIKLYSLEKNRSDELNEYRSKLAKLQFKTQIYWFINRAFIAFKDFFLTKMNLYFVGGLIIISGHMEAAILLVFMNYYEQLYNNVSTITDSILGLQTESPNIKRLLEILEANKEEKTYIKNLKDEILIQNLCFKYYDEQDLVLNNINLKISPREHVAIAGRSGCGKTTLIKLMMGLYEPLSGNIHLGGILVDVISFECISEKIGIILQEPQFFNLTIQENLRFAKRRATDDELINVCKQSNIFDFIDNLPDKFNTIVGEKGIKLSGGQRQRLSIARLLLQDPDIIIFDEATSSLDSENEKSIVSVINKISENKMIISIAHRLSTILSCNRVIVMDNGKIVAEGSHEELCGKDNVYDKLFENQYIVLV